ncbi:hypothetical protein CHH28_13655 [Bacterioplanes sanyensis]|uniref:DUF4114 domain-containing protein n=1 Tax=Bacterioplanes sanyensis TaxID=1249553 RepID=A0A222FN59_9GAMM|nr:DUF4114 domain-containing protein [Bacterioplanes sanyensis]ASP39653.1 hypothetical protein CHH28_13655 [Bacterioplanes sanyensis]
MMKTTLSAAIVLGLTATSHTTLALDTDPPEIENRTVEDSVLQTVRTALPEQKAVNTSFLNTDYDPYLTVNQEANVAVTFLDEGAGYRNSLGWFSFSDTTFDGMSKGDIDIDDSSVVSLSELNAVDGVNSGWLFPNSSEYRGGGSLLAGDTVAVGDGPLSAGTSVSFFLAQNASWGGDRVNNGVLTGSTQMFYGLDFLNPEADFTSTIDSNLEQSRHVAMLFSDDTQQQVIMGFEDLNRVDRSANQWGFRSDEDFNDAIFLVSSDPVEAFGDSNIATAPLPPLGQGIVGVLMAMGLFSFALGKNPLNMHTALA